MNIEKLEVGQVIKNYKELCSLIDEPVKSGKSKKLQVKDLERFIKFHQEGNKYIIDEIYSTPFDKIDNRGKNPNSWNNQNGAYGKYIKPLILDKLSMSDSKEILSGINYLMQDLGMVNERYRDMIYKRIEYAKYNNIKIDFVHEFCSTNGKKLKQAITKTLDDLETENIIKYKKVQMIRTTNDEYDREATLDEIEIIEEWEQKTLDSMKIYDKKHIYIANRVKEFYDILDTYLVEIFDITSSYQAYKITLLGTNYNQYILEQEARKEIKSDLNKTIYENLTESVKDRHIKNKDEISKLFWGRPPVSWREKNKNYKAIIIDKDYIKINKMLIEKCIKMNK